MVHVTNRVDTGSAVRSKSTLYCPECDHESHVLGDWTSRARGDRLQLVCPVRGTSIADRPATPNAPALPRASTRAVSAWSKFVVTSTAVWRASLATCASSASSAARQLD